MLWELVRCFHLTHGTPETLLYNQNSEALPAKSKSFMLELERVRNVDIFVLDKSCLNRVYL